MKNYEHLKCLVTKQCFISSTEWTSSSYHGSNQGFPLAKSAFQGKLYVAGVSIMDNPGINIMGWFWKDWSIIWILV